MPRYFLEVSYKGTLYAGFQKQQNANSIQAEVEKALEIYYRQKFTLTGSSRTDAGVHALQNFFHFDTDLQVKQETYNLNSILPVDIVVKQIFKVDDEAHCRFDALSREYRYYMYRQKNPFLADRAYFIPYPVNMEILNRAAAQIRLHHDFTSFSKRNTQVKSFNCTIYESRWVYDEDSMTYIIRANRFLRGMVKGLVGTMLLAGKGKISLDEFTAILNARDCTRADFSVPSHGLFLHKVAYSFNSKV
jgi:tRNA pseudouridine38-40 synthase